MTVSSTSADIGEEIVVTVSVSNNPGLGAIEFALDYDKNVLEYVSYELCTIGSRMNGVYINKYASASGTNITDDGDVVSFKFKVLDSAQLGDTTITLSDIVLAGFTEGTSYTKYDSPTINPGTVTVTEAEHLTCSAEGEMEYTCERCGETKTEVIAKLPHTEETVAGYAATCTEDGLTDGVKCSICGEIITVQEVIPAKGHTPGGEGTVVEEATYDHDGEIVYTCSVCGNEYSEVIPMLKYKVTLPDGEGYVVKASATEIAKGENYTFTITLSDGYERSKDFAVKVNGTVIEPNEDGVYVVEDVTSDIEITVDGVKETETSDAADTDEDDVTTPVTVDSVLLMAVSLIVLIGAGAALCLVMSKKKQTMSEN